jgi:hypothetical protein
MPRCALSCLVAALAAVAVAADASAATFGGGLLTGLPSARVFRPTAGVSFAFDGRPRARFDTSVKCGSRVYDIDGYGPMTVSGSSVHASGKDLRRLGSGRVTYRWDVAGGVDGSRILGVLRVVATRHVTGRPAERCRKARRGFAAVAPAPPAGAPARPAAPDTYFGLSDSRLDGTGVGSVVVRFGRSARVTARWEAVAPCSGRRPGGVFTNYTPASHVGAGGGFTRAERFSVHYSDSLVRYRVRFGGRLFSDGSAGGTLRLRTRVYKHGRLTARCDSGNRPWTARNWASAASAAQSTAEPSTPPATGEPSSPPDPKPGPWTFSAESVTSPSYLGNGESYAYGSADSQITVVAKPDRFGFEIIRRADGESWDGGFYPPGGETLQAGRTYVDDSTDEQKPNSAGMAMAAQHRACPSGIGNFVFDTLDYDATGTLRRAKLRFEYRCHAADGAVRGTLDFQAAAR